MLGPGNMENSAFYTESKPGGTIFNGHGGGGFDVTECGGGLGCQTGIISEEHGYLRTWLDGT